MSRAPIYDRAKWAVALIGALVAVGAVAVLFRAPHPDAPADKPSKVSVAMTSNPLLRDEAVIFDPAPLFLPTRFNANPRGIEMPEFGAAFPNYPPKLGFEVYGLKLDALSLPKPVGDLPAPAAAPGSALALPSPEPLASGFGRAELAVPALSPRGGYLVIKAADTGRPVIAETLIESARPPGSSAWLPLEFVAAVDPAGLVGALVLTTRSGVEEVDAHFQNHLARTLRIGERLAPGFYRICVGP
ncbi:MAG: hypothetical protein HZA93_24585 [Verrucomicrobia bacterium]|nr:hypothetical protein [Verrucomicrobiota bacterium]